MGARKNPTLILQQKFALLGNAINGRTSASASSLSASFGLDVEQVRRLLRFAGVSDDG